MFGRLHKQQSDRNGERERFDVQLSSFQALQIPKGWDRLALSVVSVETGRTVNKTAKAVVWSGNCKWTETILQSVLIARGDTSKDAEGCLFKIIVTSGSSRSNVLGEVSINLANYVEASTSVPVSLQLNKCSHGTILQMKVQCLTSKPKLRDEPVGTDFNSSFEELTIEYEELDGRSDESENISVILPRNFKSNPSQLRKSNSKDTSFSASVSGSSFDSWEGNVSNKDLSSQRKSGENWNYSSGRQNSGGSQASSADSDGTNAFDESVKLKSNSPSYSSKQQASGLPFQNQNRELRRSSQPFTASPLRNAGSSKELIEAVEVTVDELRAEARMWERNARKLMSDLDISREELSEQSEQQELLKSELSASREECNSLKQENERINIVLEDFTKKQTAEENEAEEFRKALEEEIKFQNERNADLALQLKKTQDSNVELLSVLQEFEETIDTQRAEIDTLLSAKPIEGSTADSRISELQDEIWEKEMLALSETAALKLQLAHHKEQMEVLVLNYPLVHLDSVLYALEIGQNDRDEGINSNLILGKDKVESAITLSEDRQYGRQEHDVGVDERAIPVDNPTFRSLHTKEEISIEDLMNRMAEKCSEVDDIRGDNLLKEEEIEALKSRVKELEDRIFSVEDGKSQLIETQNHMAEEGDISCKCFGGSNGGKTLPDGIDDPLVSVDKFLATTTRLDTYNNDLEDRLSELEEENVWLSERIIGLEAQLRYLTNEKESTLLSLQNSESLCSKLQNDIRKLESDMEVLGIDAKQKLLALQKRLSESLDESGSLKVVNSKLQDDSDVLIEKCRFLEKANEELKKENMELHDECTVLEAEVGELKESFLHVSTEIEVLEEKIASLMEETTLKEKALRSEVDALLRENKRINENIPEESLQEIYKVEYPETRSSNVGSDVISKHNEEVLMADREKLLDLLEDIKSKEKQLKNTIRRQNVMLKGSEYENLRLVGDIKNLELRLQRTEVLQKEVLALGRSISEAIFEKERLEASNQVLLEQYEEMKSERESLVRKISSVQRALTEVEHSRNTKAALEEKVLRLEGDLTAREALFACDAEQKNELARTRIANGELRRRIKCLQDENQECRARIQQLEEHKTQKPDKENGETLDQPSKEIRDKRSIQNEGSLEKELVELRESYSLMSLKYAEAEAHREQLVMRLKAVNGGG